MEATQNQPNDRRGLRPVCFMIMPYGTKPTHSDKGIATINYNALWDKALFPFIEEDLDYHAIRADQDLGALIIKEMIERLALADLVIADVTTPNANVYYEIGVRHAAKETGCVMIAADWAKPTFDIDQMRQVRYPLPEGEITDETAAAVRKALKQGVQALMEGRSPVYDSLPGFPAKAAAARTASFQKSIEELSRFSTDVRTVRLLPKDKRAGPTVQLLQRYKTVAPKIPAVALEIIFLLRDSADWQGVLNFYNGLPEKLQNLPLIKEQRSLAVSKAGNHVEAIAAIEELIALSGESSERRGLLGGRYKKLYNEAMKRHKAQNDDNSLQEASGYLAKAIVEYDKGMRLDLNEYFCSCNLPRLLRTRGRRGDDEKAKAAATLTVMACERKAAIDPSDPWRLPTLLAAAFDAGDVDKAGSLYEKMVDEGVQPFNLDSVLPDLELAVSLQANEETKEELTRILADIRQL